MWENTTETSIGAKSETESKNTKQKRTKKNKKPKGGGGGGGGVNESSKNRNLEAKRRGAQTDNDDILYTLHGIYHHVQGQYLKKNTSRTKHI